MFCVAGADGFFGTYYISMLLRRTGSKILALNHSSPVFPDSERLTNVSFELSDAESRRRAAAALKDCRDINILFLASVHNPDIVRRDPERALHINTECYESFLEAVKELDIRRLIYASSDTVYGESTDGRAFSEKDAAVPVNIYGEQKLKAERITLDRGFSVVRYSYMLGPSLTARKKHFYDTVRDSLAEGEKFPLLTDWIRPAVSYTSASDITYRLFTSDKNEKIVNVCGDTLYSKYDIGLKIAEKDSLDSSLLVAATKKELGIFTEKRADTLSMDNSLLKAITGEDFIDLVF